MTDRTRSDKFKESARDLKTDEDEKRWETNFKKVVGRTPDERKTEGMNGE